MLNRSNPYYRQVELLVALLPLVGQEECFALKGGSAINLFMRNLPRLSIDLDLTFLPVKDRAPSLAEIDAALSRIRAAVSRTMPDAIAQQAGGREEERTKLFILRNGVRVKVEASPVLRGAVGSPAVCGVCAEIENQFGYSEMLLLHPHDIYAGKLCAALDRQHPRDLFDVKLLLEGEGIGDQLLPVFIVYLISGNRPLAEMLAPQLQPLNEVFETQFRGMTAQPIRLEALEEIRERLVREVHARLSDDQRQFLMSFKSGTPDWSLLQVPDAEKMPAVMWKLINIRKMPKAKHKKALDKLEKVLFG